MLNEAMWLVLAIAAPVLLASAIGYALLKQRRMTSMDRAVLREESDTVYEDAEEDDGCPIRFDTTRRPTKASGGRGAYGHGRFAHTTR